MNERVLPSQLEGRRVIGDEIYASNEDDLKENDIIQDDDSSISIVVSKSQDNAIYIRRRLELSRDNFLKSKSNKKTYVLTDNVDIDAVGNIPKVIFME